MGLLAPNITPHLGPENLTVITPGPVDAHGDPTGPETRVPLPGCQVQPAGSAENLDGRDTITTRMRVYAPAQVAVTATDRIEWNGTVWDVDGTPERWADLAGTPAHQEFVIVSTTG